MQQVVRGILLHYTIVRDTLPACTTKGGIAMPALQVRLSEEEYKACKERAKAAGVSMSELVRGLLMEPVRSPEVPEIPAFEELAIGESWGSAPKVLAGVPPIVEEPESREAGVLGALKSAAAACEFDPENPGKHEPRPPMVLLAPPLPEPPRHGFKRHPACTTEKCERIGNACTLCRMTNAISFQP